MQEFKSVLVTWVDACSQDAWEDLKTAKELAPHEIKTLGWLIFEDDIRVVVSTSYDRERGAVAGTWSIPKAWLVDIQEILV